MVSTRFLAILPFFAAPGFASILTTRQNTPTACCNDLWTAQATCDVANPDAPDTGNFGRTLDACNCAPTVSTLMSQCLSCQNGLPQDVKDANSIANADSLQAWANSYVAACGTNGHTMPSVKVEGAGQSSSASSESSTASESSSSSSTSESSEVLSSTSEESSSSTESSSSSTPTSSSTGGKDTSSTTRTTRTTFVIDNENDVSNETKTSRRVTQTVTDTEETDLFDKDDAESAASSVLVSFTTVLAGSAAVLATLMM